MNIKKNWWKILIALVGLVYISNLGAGVIELIPDNIPLAGNIDEGAMGAIVWAAISAIFKR